MFKKSASRTCAGIMSLAVLLGTAGMLPANKAAAAASVTINEVCPKNTTYAAPDGGFYDYVELYNSSGSSVDISGWGITDKAEKPYRFTIPAGTVIPAGGRKVIFFDGTAGETNSSIAPFGLSTSGETITLTDNSGSIASQVTFGDMASDTSYGQYPDGSGEFYVLSTTPDAANQAPEGPNAVRTPSFSAESGFYNNSFALTIDVPQGTTVYYTTDGSDPTASSERYTAPITVQDMTNTPNRLSARTDISANNQVTPPAEGVLKAAVVRAVAVDGQGRTSDIITKTYFIGSTNVDKYKNMKVISLVTDPDNLFDNEKGIYVIGNIGGNTGNQGWGQDWNQNWNQGNQGDQNNQNGDQNQNQDWNQGWGQDWNQNWNQGDQNNQNGDQNQNQDWNQGWGQDWNQNWNQGNQGDQNNQNGDQNQNQDWNQGWNQGGFDFGGFNFGDTTPTALADEDNGGNDQQQGGWGGFGDGGFGGFGGGGFDFGNWGGGFGTAPANYTQKGRAWERPANIEIFENGQSVVSQNVGIRIKGAYSRSAVQKSFNIYTRMDYGKGDLEFDLFEGKSVKAKNGKTINTFDGFTIRNGGNDTLYGYFRDSINQSLVMDRDFAAQATSECIVFIDGEFWGIYQLMEKIDEDYFKSHYGVKKNDVAYIKNNELEAGTDQDKSEWDSLINQIANGDMSNQATYEQIKSKLDIQSYIDYFCAQMYWNNSDWPHNNVACWRADTVDESNAYADGKWRMVMFDTEYSLALYNHANEDYDANPFTRIMGNGGGWGMGMGGSNNFSRTLGSLLKNAEFKEQFERTMMDLANYNFDTSKTTAAINYYKNNYKQQILDTYARFDSANLSGAKGEQKFNNEYDTMTRFYNNRYDVIASTMKNALGLTGNLAKVTVSNDGSKGSVKFNTIKLDDSLSTWSGKYYTDYPVTVKASPKDGYSFDHWEVTGATVANTSSDEITVPVSEGVTIKAVYRSGSSVPADTTTTTKVTTTTTTTTTQTTTTSAQPTSFTDGNVTLLGDANCDDGVDLSDAVMIMQALANPNKYGVNGSDPKHMTQQGAINADVDKTSLGLTPNDALRIQEHLLGISPLFN